jgi:hypothetical protein
MEPVVEAVDLPSTLGLDMFTGLVSVILTVVVVIALVLVRKLQVQAETLSHVYSQFIETLIRVGASKYPTVVAGNPVSLAELPDVRVPLGLLREAVEEGRKVLLRGTIPTGTVEGDEAVPRVAYDCELEVVKVSIECGYGGVVPFEGLYESRLAKCSRKRPARSAGDVDEDEAVRVTD